MFGFARRKLKRQATDVLTGMIDLEAKYSAVTGGPSAYSLIDSVWSADPLVVEGRNEGYPHFLTVAFEAACSGAADESLDSANQSSLLKIAVQIAGSIKGKYRAMDDAIVDIGLEHLRYTAAFKRLQA